MPAFGASCAGLGFPSVALPKGLDGCVFGSDRSGSVPIFALGFPLPRIYYTLYPIPYVVEEQILW